MVKRKLFVLTLKGSALTWFKGLEDNSINSWVELCEDFTSHFTTRLKQPKTMVALNAIIHDKKETSREYVERFTRKVVESHDVQNNLKFFIFENSLRDDSNFKDELGLREARDMSDFLTRVQPYINYEEKRIVEETLKIKQSGK